MLRIGLVGIGKMGISHLALLGAHPDVEVAGICDSQAFMTSFFRSVSDVKTYKSHDKLIESSALDGVFISTPTGSHVEVASAALDQGLHVFVEKPLSLTGAESYSLSQRALARGVTNQVGYHNRFIGTFAEMHRLATSGAIGQIYHIDGRAFGPVVTKPRKGFTWRAKRADGGGCLHDYASHVIDLMNWMVGPPQKVIGARLQSVFSDSVEDVAFALLSYENGATGQVEVNWSDETYRKMSTSITIYGSEGKLISDRQELQVYLKPGCDVRGYSPGWTTRYITELQPPVRYYLRGEEYSAQVDSFVAAALRGDTNPENSFHSAYETDRVIEMIANTHERTS